MDEEESGGENFLGNWKKKKKTTIYKGKWRLSYKSNLFLLAFFKNKLKKKNDKNNSWNIISDNILFTSSHSSHSFFYNDLTCYKFYPMYILLFI
jgi:hypothetical protein